MLLLLACVLTPDSKDSTGTPLACDTLTCGGDEVCVVEQYEPVCQNLDDTAGACPDGTTRSMCGGAGIPCCCEPTPAPTYSCAECSGEPSCDCVTCPADKACEATGTAGTFQCAELPKP